jgi:hypothetical protein
MHDFFPQLIPENEFLIYSCGEKGIREILRKKFKTLMKELSYFIFYTIFHIKRQLPASIPHRKKMQSQKASNFLLHSLGIDEKNFFYVYLFAL